MASPAEIVQPLPDTLPEDFSEWDGGNSSATMPVNSGGSEAARTFDAATDFDAAAEAESARHFEPERDFEPARKFELGPDFEPATRPQAATSRVAEIRPPAKASPAVKVSPEAKIDSAPAIAPPPASEPALAPASLDVHTSAQIKILATLDGATPAPLFSATGFYASKEDELEERENRKRIRNKRISWAVGAVAAILLVLIPLRYSGMLGSHAAKQATADSSAASDQDSDSASNKSKPSPATPLTRNEQAAVKQAEPLSATPSSADDAPAATTDADNNSSQPVEPTMMNAQLSAPKQIPHDINVVPKPAEAPPSAGFGTAGTEGLGGSGVVGADFAAGNKERKVSIEIPKRVAVSGNSASALLLQKTTPIYPAVARVARVSGTVTLDAVISKSGTVQSLRVVSGPATLRQAAIDAVNAWRYKPYLFSGVPVEMETTVNVAFTIPGK